MRVFRGHGSRGPEELTEEEIDELVDEWKPEPLVPVAQSGGGEVEVATLSAFAPDGKHVFLEGSRNPVLNASSFNFLGFASNQEVKDAGRETLLTFSCGSCGPRGFYGTTVKHLDLEASLAKYFGVPEAICYSGGLLAFLFLALLLFTLLPPRRVLRGFLRHSRIQQTR